MLKVIGKYCKEYRQRLELKQVDVSKATGYSLENVAAFEQGRNDNVRIFMWYVNKGLDLDRLCYILREELEHG